MRYRALATDYDGTLAADGKVDEATTEALERVARTGRKLILVTGRQLEDLLGVFEGVRIFDRVVAENGAVLYRPATDERLGLAPAPEQTFVEALRRRGVDPVSVGHSIVATWQPHESTVLEVIRELGLELQVTFNKGAVMVLPSGVNKATGLRAALAELGISPHNVIGIGDAENDHAFLQACEYAVAVENALPSLKDACDLVTGAARGAGVAEVIHRLLDDDLASVPPPRQQVVLGEAADGTPFSVEPFGVRLLVAGPSGSGKSTTVTALLEQLGARSYQYCIIDPEGDYETFPGVVALGGPGQAPALDEVVALLEDPTSNVSVNLLGIALGDRPQYFEALASRLRELVSRTGRPHWLVVDEAHHMIPEEQPAIASGLLDAFGAVLGVTVHPEWIAPTWLEGVDTVIAVGDPVEPTLDGLAKRAGHVPPEVSPRTDEDHVFVWQPRAGREPLWIRRPEPTAERRRHLRKYAEGNLGEDRSFYFTGPDGKLNLRAQNLILFAQIAEGVDDETWRYHLERGDYSRWFTVCIKDEQLASEARDAESDDDPARARERILAAIASRYTAPA